jgi:hypothetical protein
MKQGSALKRSNNDPELLPGNGVFVDESKFQKFLKDNQNVAQASFHLANIIIIV